MAKPDFLREGVEVPTESQQGSEFQGVPGANSEHFEGGKVGRVEVGVTAAATKDLSNLTNAVGQSVNPQTAAKIESSVQQGEVTAEEVVETIQSGDPVESPAELLERMMNLADSGK